MFGEEWKHVYLLLFLLFTIRARADSSTISTMIEAQTTSKQPAIQSSTTIISPKRQSSSQSTTHSNSQTTKGVSNNDDKIEPWVIIVISTSAAVILVAIFILSLLCICRRRRIQRLERERNLSYTNANYESTVKFRADMGADGTTLESDLSPQRTNNNPGRDAAGYERVELPSEKKPPQYENVSPQHHPKKENASHPNQQYENVTPMVSSGNDKAKDVPVRPYEEVLLDSPKETNDDKKNKKHYENVELKI